MKVVFKRSFLKSLKKLKDQKLKNKVAKSILQVEAAANISQLKNLKKLAGYSDCYRNE